MNIKLYYSIGEVAEEFGVSESLLRYWEKVFPSICPKKTSKLVRQYTKEDIEEIRLIYNLVKVRGMKLSAAQDALKRNRERVTRTAKVMHALENLRSELLALRSELDQI